MSQVTASQSADRATRTGIEDLSRRMSRLEQADVLIGDGRRLFLRSPNGHFWSIGVSDAGALTVTDMGTAVP